MKHWRIALFLILAASTLLTRAHAQLAFRAASQAASASGALPAYVASATATVNGSSITIALPTGAAQDDILIAQVTIKDIQTVTPPAPIGSWTLIDVTSNGSLTQAVYWRRAGASEPASYTWTWSSSERAAAAITAYRNVEALLDPIDASGVRTNTSPTITLPTITTNTTNTMLVALLGSSRAGNNHGVPMAMTAERYEINPGGGPNGVNSSLADQVQAAVGSSGAKTASSSNSTDNIAHVVALRRAGALTIDVPAGTATGDVMIASIAVRPCSAASGAACTVSAGAPAGWTLINTLNQTTGGASGNRMFVYSRLATAADIGASYTWTFAGVPAHTGAAGGILSFSGVDPVNPIVDQAGQATASGPGHIAPSINTGTQVNTMLVSSHAANASGTWSAPAGMTEQVEIASLALTNNAGISLQINTEARPAAGATGTRTAMLSNPPAANTGAAHMLALKPAVTLDHFSISHAATGVACVDQTITITAHDASHAAVDANSTTITLATSNGRGTWTGIVAGGGVLNDPTAGDGAATYTFAAGSNQVSLAFRYANLAASSEVFGFNVSNGTVSEAAGSANVSDDPSFTMSQAGFVFSAIPTQISGKPSDTGFNATAVRVQAVRTDTKTGSCSALFASQNRTVQLGAECNNPTACAAQQVSINGTNIATSNNDGASGATAYTDVSLAFNASSQADTVITYPAAGQMSLHARYDADPKIAGYEMLGASNLFVVRPFALRISGPATSATPGPTEPVFRRAGQDFDVTITAVQWQAADDGNGDGVQDSGADLSNNAAALNFGLETVPTMVDLSRALALTHPVGGINPGLGGSTAFSGFVSSAKTQTVNWGEVGFIDLTATSFDYLGIGALTNTLAGVGRFYPDHFFLSAGSIANRAGACGGSSFTYMNEGVLLSLTLQARNAAGAVTQNYTTANSYAKLNPASIGLLGLGAVATNPAGTSTNLSARLDQSLGSAGSFNNGVAAITATVPVSRGSPDNPDGPYTNTRFGVAAQEPIAALGGDGVTMRSADFNLDVDGAGGNDHVHITDGVTLSTSIRYGRLRMQNAVGSEKLALPIPLETQYWNGAGFVTNAQDSCTSFPRSAIVLSGYTGALDPAGGNCKTFVQQDPIGFAGGVATVTLAAPAGAIGGSVLLTPNLRAVPAGSFCDNATSGENAATAAAMSYLLGRWDDSANPDGSGATAYDDNPSARAAFGLFGSQPNNFIYFRENF